MAKKQEMDMTSGSILNKMIVFTIPVVLTGILQLLYNAADIAVVGKFAGKEALAAVGAATPLANLLLNFFIGLSAGSNVVLANSCGEGNEKKISDTVHTSILLSIICGILFGIIGLIFSKPMLLLMNTPKDTLELADVYIKILFLGMPASLVYNFGAAMLRAIGDTKRPLYFLIITGVVNVVLNLVLVIVFKMSVAGVAIATIISQYISAILILIRFAKSSGSYKLNLKKMKFAKKELSRILALGIPSGIQSTVFSISNTIIQSAINGFGSVAVAGNSISLNIEGFVYTAGNAVSQATISFTGQNFGAGKMDRIKKVFIYGCAISSAITLLLSGLAIIFIEPLSKIYTSSAEVIEYSVLRMYWIGPAYILCAVMDIILGSFRGMGKSFTSMVSCILGVCGIRIVWVFTVFKLFPTLPVLYSSYTASWIGTTIILLIVLSKTFKKVAKQFA